MGFIFEQEIDQILSSVRAQTIGESESITLRQLIVGPIHPALKAYFRAEVEQLLEDERSKEVRSKRFPYGFSEVISLQRQIDVLLVQHYEFTQDDFERILDEAVHFQFNYLCRPQWTLLNYVVGDRRRVGMSEVERKLARCVDYRYFPELIRRYAVDRGLAEVTYEEFRSLIERIDQEVLKRHTAGELAGMTRSLISFVDFGKTNPYSTDHQPKLPTNAAIVFFEDKHLEEIKIRLEVERDQHGRDLMTLQDLVAVLRETWVDPVPELAETRTDPGSPMDEAGGSLFGEPSHQGSEADASSGARVEEQEPVPVVERIPESAESSELPDVHELFTKADVKRFTKTIFQKDDVSFRTALDDLNRFAVWDDASHFLDDLFVLHNVDPFSKEAVDFTDRVYARYFPS
jgi:hypothetical protein